MSDKNDEYNSLEDEIISYKMGDETYYLMETNYKMGDEIYYPMETKDDLKYRWVSTNPQNIDPNADWHFVYKDNRHHKEEWVGKNSFKIISPKA